MKRSKSWRCLVLVTVVALMGGVTIAAQAPSAPAGSSHEREAGRKPGDGIKVHGHWTIDVRNPDGTLVSHTEFENALLASGAGALAALLSKEWSISSWNIKAWNHEVSDDQLSPCRSGEFYRSACQIWQADYHGGVPDWGFATLAVQAPKDSSGGYLGTLELTGNFTASFDGSITIVQTELFIPNGPGPGIPFSGTTLPAPIHSAVGQTVYIKVVLSFS